MRRRSSSPATAADEPLTVAPSAAGRARWSMPLPITGVTATTAGGASGRADVSAFRRPVWPRRGSHDLVSAYGGTVGLEQGQVGLDRSLAVVVSVSVRAGRKPR